MPLKRLRKAGDAATSAAGLASPTTAAEPAVAPEPSQKKRKARHRQLLSFPSPQAEALGLLTRAPWLQGLESGNVDLHVRDSGDHQIIQHSWATASLQQGTQARFSNHSKM